VVQVVTVGAVIMDSDDLVVGLHEPVKHDAHIRRFVDFPQQSQRCIGGDRNVDSSFPNQYLVKTRVVESCNELPGPHVFQALSGMRSAYLFQDLLADGSEIPWAGRHLYAETQPRLGVFQSR